MQVNNITQNYKVRLDISTSPLSHETFVGQTIEKSNKKYHLLIALH